MRPITVAVLGATQRAVKSILANFATKYAGIHYVSAAIAEENWLLADRLAVGGARWAR